MAKHLQNQRGLAIETPLGEDQLLLTGFRGQEAISQLFHFDLDLIAEAEATIAFDQIIGQSVKVKISVSEEEKRVIRGIIKSLTQVGRGRISGDGEHDVFVSFRAEMVPHLWLLTKKVRNRIFQQISTPEILREVFSGFVVDYEISGTYYPRDYCVQYQESDFDFACRLMEEEGICYFFPPGEDGPSMVVTDGAAFSRVQEMPAANYREAASENFEEVGVYTWEKTQQLRSNDCVLWDYCFELPGNHLEAKEKMKPNVKVGSVDHRLDLGANDGLEVFCFPGRYAQRFDGIDCSGAPQSSSLHSIFEDGQRTARIRVEQEECASIEIRGISSYASFSAGSSFKLNGHFDADDRYLLTSVTHCVTAGGYQANSGDTSGYKNKFTCIPVALPFRPPCVTRRPVIAGMQTATVAGPQGGELFCDKYGRVKVQFHWDRDGKADAKSSCWLRVAQVWAGSGWGAVFWPRIGNEVVVVFEEGDPDQPLIIGSVYNADNLPPFELPAKNYLAGIKSASLSGRAYKNFNGVVFDDRNGHEHLALHSERHMSFNSEFDKIFHAGRHKGERVSGANVFTVGNLPSGGSGGGSSAPWPKPYPQGIVGLNSTMVYGENMQAVVGTNHQLAVGNNFQICINPAGLIMCAGDSLPEVPFFTEALTSGIGGNMQLTVGTSAQLVYGQNIEVDAGMPKLELHRDGKTANGLSYGLVAVIGGLAVAYSLAYGLLSKDYDRAATTIVFQGCLDVILTILMKAELELKQADTSESTAPGTSFVDQVDNAMDRLREKDRQELMGHAKHIDWTMVDAGEFMGSPMRYSPSATNFFESLSVVLAVAAVPLVLVAQHEKDPEEALQQSQTGS